MRHTLTAVGRQYIAETPTQSSRGVALTTAQELQTALATMSHSGTNPKSSRESRADLAFAIMSSWDGHRRRPARSLPWFVVSSSVKGRNRVEQSRGRAMAPGAIVTECLP